MKGIKQMKPNKVEVGNRLKEIRSRLNLTISEFGIEVGNIPKGTAYSWERGRALPPEEKLKRIAFLADTTINWILWGNDLKQATSGRGHTHEFDISPEQYELIDKVLKKQEIRKYDRDYAEGDFLLLKEYKNEEFTGREIMQRITSLAKYEHELDYVIMSIEFVPKSFRQYEILTYKEKVIFKEALTAIHDNPQPGYDLVNSLRKIVATLLDGHDKELWDSDFQWYISLWNHSFD
jgi:transcriptional regulator with XRE-family HTH domain